MGRDEVYPAVLWRDDVPKRSFLAPRAMSRYETNQEKARESIRTQILLLDFLFGFLQYE